MIGRNIVIALMMSSTPFSASSSITKTTAHVTDTARHIDDIYRQSQRQFRSKDYENAMVSFKEYLAKTTPKNSDENRIFGVINQIGYIFLKVKSDTDGTIKFLKQYSNDPRLNEADQTTVLEWISAAEELKKDKQFWNNVPHDAERLFSTGKRLFVKGIAKKTFPMDSRGNLDLWAARKYLSPFINHFDSNPNATEALLMMGRIRMYLHTDKDYWTENFYLKEVIRRAPGTDLAKDAWKHLNDDVHFGYTGSSGDNTPSSMKRMLDTYKKIAFSTSSRKTDSPKERG